MRDIRRAARLDREERRRLAENVGEQHVAQVADDPLPDVGHQVARDVRRDAFHQVDADDGADRQDELLVPRQHVIENRLNQRGHACRGRAVDHHRHHRGRQSPTVRARIGDQTKERAHSLNRYRSRTHSATTPSRQPIFLPSAYPRPS